MTVAPRGRPRAFDRDDALRTALYQFWEHGYEPVSVADLTTAMNIRPPSLYAAFGNKRQLFAEAVDLYEREVGGYVGRSMQEPTAYQAVERLLVEAAENYTGPDRPTGCLIVLGATNCERDGEVREDLLRRRNETRLLVRERIETDIEAGALPADTNAGSLAGLVVSVLHGMAIQARDGATRHELYQIAAAAMSAWPGNGRTSD